MEQKLITYDRHSRILIFFAGWASDEKPFESYTPYGCDYMICYDYRSLDFDASLLSGYSKVDIVAWSMGVWAASQVLSGLNLPIESSVAINGTVYPVDDTRGISQDIYHGTLNELSERTLQKFLRRMCIDSAAYKKYLENAPERPLSELRDELVAIESMYRSMPDPDFHWQQAVVGNNDRIIPPENQQRSWEEVNTRMIQTDDAHYQEELFKFYLQKRWIND